MQTVASFHKVEDAHLFRMFLESEGVEAAVLDEYLPQINWLYTFAVGGIRVCVDDGDAGRGRELLSVYEERTLAGPPATGDLKAWPVILLASFLVGLPMFFFGRKALSNTEGNP